jgi:hypothetical protein
MKREAAGSNLIPWGLDTVTVSTSCVRRNPDLSSIIIVIQFGETFIIKLEKTLKAKHSSQNVSFQNPFQLHKLLANC